MKSNNLRDYVRVREDGWTGFVHTDFKHLSPDDLAGQTATDVGTSLEKVASSDTAQVYRYSVPIGGQTCTLFLKKYLYRSWLDKVKHLLRPSRAERAFGAGITLERHGLHTPQIAALLIKKNGLFVTQNILLTRELKQARALHTFFEDTPSSESSIPLKDKRFMLAELGTTIGRMHGAGIFHGDLRGGNVFVLKNADKWTFYFIDNERTAQYPMLPFWLRNKNLVQLNMLEQNITSTDRMRFLGAYSYTAELTKKHARRIATTVRKKTLRRLRHRAGTRTGLSDASLQTHWDFQRVRLGSRKGIFLTDFCKRDKAAELLGQIDTLMETAFPLKKDTATRVVRCTWNNRDIVIKRYNFQGLWHSLRHTLKGSRARKSWRFGHRLTAAHIPCAAPLAVFEEYAYGIIRQSYIVNEYIEGPLLYDVMNRPGHLEAERKAVMQKAEQLLENLGQHRLTHADMKPANMIIHQGQPVLIDLDSMEQHRIEWYFLYRYKKMVSYFHRRLYGKKIN